MTYIKPETINPNQFGDSVKEAVLKNDTNMDEAFRALNELGVVLDEEMSWVGDWVAGAYKKSDVVRDGYSTLVAKVDTSEKPVQGGLVNADWDLMADFSGASLNIIDNLTSASITSPPVSYTHLTLPTICSV